MATPNEDFYALKRMSEKIVSKKSGYRRDVLSKEKRMQVLMVEGPSPALCCCHLILVMIQARFGAKFFKSSFYSLPRANPALLCDGSSPHVRTGGEDRPAGSC